MFGDRHGRGYLRRHHPKRSAAAVVRGDRPLFPAQLPDADRRPRSPARPERRSAATGWRFGASHIEVEAAPDGPVIIEINARLAGGMIPELVRLATGVDLVEQQVRAAAGLTVAPVETPSGVAGIAFVTTDVTGTLREVAGVANAREVGGVTQVTVTAVPGTTVCRPRDAYHRLGYVIAAGASHPEVTSRLDKAIGLLRPVVEECA